MRDNNIKLRQEVFVDDAWKIIDWLEDDEVIQYLNEGQNVCKSIKQVIHRTNMPILTHLFNQDGSFFMLTTKDKEPIGFLRLVPKKKGAEMVIVIGDREKWGQGLGPEAIFEGLKHAFFQWRVDEVIAKINFKNERSKKAFKKIGFTEDKELPREMQYSISMEEFLEIAA
ncbi:GNAT family N-acetyltransferase [Clostridium sp. MSJ-4]|uniref:GNAT family N-acetyltransferase n=1 Tax=Clostridium simiarum TaxID=2841506 RepID=A0ABS6EVD1_9CLOT|nr:MULTISPECIES: GNAT family protein [Clostridium]MBU5590175.1 GNAT family N-acetyltransferase [Clostridium simiarum]